MEISTYNTLAITSKLVLPMALPILLLLERVRLLPLDLFSTPLVIYSQLVSSILARTCELEQPTERALLARKPRYRRVHARALGNYPRGDEGAAACSKASQDRHGCSFYCGIPVSFLRALEQNCGFGGVPK